MLYTVRRPFYSEPLDDVCLDNPALDLFKRTIHVQYAWIDKMFQSFNAAWQAMLLKYTKKFTILLANVIAQVLFFEKSVLRSSSPVIMLPVLHIYFSTQDITLYGMFSEMYWKIRNTFRKKKKASKLLMYIWAPTKHILLYVRMHGAYALKRILPSQKRQQYGRWW